VKTMRWKWHQTSTLVEWSGRGEVKPSLPRTVMKTDARASNRRHREYLNFSNRPVRTRMPGGVAGESGHSLPLCRCQVVADPDMSCARC
jgi:hypothetical protein